MPAGAIGVTGRGGIPCAGPPAGVGLAGPIGRIGCGVGCGSGDDGGRAPGGAGMGGRLGSVVGRGAGARTGAPGLPLATGALGCADGAAGRGGIGGMGGCGGAAARGCATGCCAAGGGAVGRGGATGLGAAAAGCVLADGDSLPMVITPPQTEQRARTPVGGILVGSTRNTERHSGHETFIDPRPPRRRSGVSQPRPLRRRRAADRSCTPNREASSRNSSSPWPTRSLAPRA